jgi:hypothetical protein
MPKGPKGEKRPAEAFAFEPKQTRSAQAMARRRFMV